MLVKPVFILAFAIRLVSCFYYDKTSPYFRQYNTIVRLYGDLSQCNKTLCGPPCPGAEPPSHCPKVVAMCSSGCVCQLDCEHAINYCYETQDCLERAHLIRRQRKRPSIDDILE